MFIVFDLDGTLALNEHRQHHVTGEKKDFDAFNADCGMDEPCLPLIELLVSMYEYGHQIEIWSGRSDNVQRQTFSWFDQHGVPRDVEIRMRPTGDHCSDVELKLRFLAEAPKKPDLIFDDRASVVKMWREQGIVCCQVAPGNF